jgi:CoA:oxalate CoA-transferase
VYVSLSGYGQTGPWADLPGHDINYLAAAGVLAVSGVPGGGPAQSFGLPVADLCGAMYALSSTLAALYQRQHTGQGQHLDVALADCALHWMNPRVGAWREAGAHTLEAQREATLVKPAYGAFACRDGRHVSIAALEDHFWVRLCEALDLAPYGGEAFRAMKARKAVAGAINARIAEVLADRDADEVFALLQRHDVPAAPVVEPSRWPRCRSSRSAASSRPATTLPVARYPVPMAGVRPGRLGGAPVARQRAELTPWRRSSERASPSCSASRTRSWAAG